VVTASDNGMRTLLCSARGVRRPDIALDQIDRFIADRDNLLWLDVDLSVTDDLRLLREEFGFHELALEDATRFHQRPKIETYDGYFFLIFYTVELRRAAAAPAGQDLREQGLLRAQQVAIFVGPNYLVTVHQGGFTLGDEVATRWQLNVDRLDRSVGALAYSLLDAIVDSYFPVIDGVADLVEEVEEMVFERFDEHALEDIFALKKGLLGMRRVLAPERDVLNVMIRRDNPLFGDASLLYFQDVYDHVVRITDAIDIYRDLLGSVLDAYLSLASNRLNQTVRTLTSWTIPLMAGALLAGIWGMNFEHMPELGWRFGYPLALLLIAGTIAAITLWFHRRRWL
jgi:magnesium transporter